MLLASHFHCCSAFLPRLNVQLSDPLHELGRPAFRARPQQLGVAPVSEQSSASEATSLPIAVLVTMLDSSRRTRLEDVSHFGPFNPSLVFGETSESSKLQG